MLTAEIRINGCMLAHVHVVNRGPVNKAEVMGDLCEYEWEVYQPEADSRKAGLLRGTTAHQRSAGALELIRNVIVAAADVPKSRSEQRRKAAQRKDDRTPR
jgi:hypothetical protein